MEKENEDENARNKHTETAKRRNFNYATKCLEERMGNEFKILVSEYPYLVYLRNLNGTSLLALSMFLNFHECSLFLLDQPEIKSILDIDLLFYTVKQDSVEVFEKVLDMVPSIQRVINKKSFLSHLPHSRTRTHHIVEYACMNSNTKTFYYLDRLLSLKPDLGLDTAPNVFYALVFCVRELRNKFIDGYVNDEEFRPNEVNVDEIVGKMRACGAQLKLPPHVQPRPLLHQCCTPTLEIFTAKAFLKLDKTLASAVDPIGLSPLHRVACSSRSPDLLSFARLLLDNGANIDEVVRANPARNPFPLTPLGLSLTRVHARLDSCEEFAVCLVTQGADVFRQMRGDLDCLKLSIQEHLILVLKAMLQRKDVVAKLQSKEINYSPLMEAVRSFLNDRNPAFRTNNQAQRNLDVIKMLLDIKVSTREALFFLCLSESKLYCSELLKFLFQPKYKSLIAVNFPAPNKFPMLFYHCFEFQEKSSLRFLINAGANGRLKSKPSICLNEVKPHRTISFASLVQYRIFFNVQPEQYRYLCHRCLEPIRNDDAVFSCEASESTCDCRVCGKCAFFKSNGPRGISVKEMALRCRGKSGPATVNYLSYELSQTGLRLQPNHSSHLEVLAAAKILPEGILRFCKDIDFERIGVPRTVLSLLLK